MLPPIQLQSFVALPGKGVPRPLLFGFHQGNQALLKGISSMGKDRLLLFLEIY